MLSVAKPVASPVPSSSTNGPGLVGYAIQTLSASSPQLPAQYRLFVDHRPGRGLIMDPLLDEVYDASDRDHLRGVIITFIGDDGATEQLGSIDNPLPIELVAATQTQQGLEILYVDTEARSIVNAQILWTSHDRTDQERARERA